MDHAQRLQSVLLALFLKEVKTVTPNPANPIKETNPTPNPNIKNQGLVTG